MLFITKNREPYRHCLYRQPKHGLGDACHVIAEYGKGSQENQGRETYGSVLVAKVVIYGCDIIKAEEKSQT
jgi:hypothetical protein